MSNIKLLTSRASFLLSPAFSSATTHFPLYVLQVSHFSSTSNYSPPYYSNYRRQDEESRNVRVSVWWDFENCKLPAGVSFFKVASSIIEAVRANGIKGPVHITAIGNMLQLSRANQEALSSTGVNLTHIPNGGKNNADRSLVLDLLYWVSQNPPPAHLFLISGDKDFSSVLHRLRMCNYNILLASPENAPGVLCSAATIMWRWQDLLKGDNLTGQHFNQPPDGPHGSWYGHYKVPLEKPILDTEPQICLQNDDLPEPSSDVKLRPIPKVVVKQIWRILYTHPEGLSISELRSELGKSELRLDKDLYGYKKFSRFLLAMPHILKLQSNGDGHYIVCSTSKAPEPFECNSDVSEHVTSHEDKDICADSSDNGVVERNFPLPTSPEKSSTTPSTDLNIKKAVKEDRHSPLDGKVVNMGNKSDVDFPTSHPEKVADVSNKQDVNVANEQESRSLSSPVTIQGSWSTDLNAKKAVKEERHAPLDGKVADVTDKQDVNVANDKKCKSHLSLATVQGTSSEVGFMKRIWRKWFSTIIGGPENENNKDRGKLCGSEKKGPLETNFASNSASGKGKSSLKSTVSVVDPVSPSSSSWSSDESALHHKVALPEACTGKDSTSTSYFSRIMNWCKFFISTTSSEGMRNHSDNRPPSFDGDESVKHGLLSDKSFWCEMESFMNTHKGYRLISKSRTREHMAHNLQNEGPLGRRHLSEKDLLRLVDLLISEKKWVEECTSQSIPFKLASSFGKNSCLKDPHISNRLESIVLDMQSQSDAHRSPEHDREVKCENAQHPEAKPVSDKNQMFRSKSQILDNCQKLLNDILKEHPEGYDISLFKNLFLERYGHWLDHEKLGYKKLAHLLQTMPKVKIESGFIIPIANVPDTLTFGNAVNVKQDRVNDMESNLDSELSDPSRKEDDFESPWEELGPLANTRCKKSEVELLTTKRASERPMDFAHEPYLSDDDLSDSVEERSPISGAEVQKKTTVDKRENFLLQILDTLDSHKESDICKVKAENANGKVDRLTDISKLSGSSVTGSKSEALMKNGRRPRPKKGYTFVSDQVTS